MPESWKIEISQNSRGLPVIYPHCDSLSVDTCWASESFPGYRLSWRVPPFLLLTPAVAAFNLAAYTSSPALSAMLLGLPCWDGRLQGATLQRAVRCASAFVREWRVDIQLLLPWPVSFEVVDAGRKEGRGGVRPNTWLLMLTYWFLTEKLV